jgi:hypothetical protein
MARALTGPYGCEGAKGSIGGLTLTQHPTAGTVLKRKPQPSNPQTAAQMGNRGMFGFVGSQWANLSAEEKANWEQLGQSSQISGFAAFSKHNANRWQMGKTPTQDYPAAETATPSTSVTLTVTNRNDAPDSAVAEVTAGAHDWGVIFYRGTAGNPTGTKSEVIAIRELTPSQANTVQVDHDGDDADIIKVAVFTDDGKRGSLVAPAA